MFRKRSNVAAVLVPLMIGLFGFFTLAQRQRFAAIHTVDVLQLLASGMCFGIALAALLMIFRKPREL